MYERAALLLDNMKRAASDAISFVSGVSEEQFLADSQLQAAVGMCLIVIGESATKLSQKQPDFVSAHPDWPWHEMRGLRNRVVHDYTRLDMHTIWDAVTTSLPPLLQSIDALGELDPRLRPKD